jgi:mRNA interferase MazF
VTKGRIVLVSFPFDDMSGAKVRPAVCLTDTVGPHRHVVLAFITSQTSPDRLDSDVVLYASAPDFGATGLKTTSTLRLHRLMTVTETIIRRDLGFLPQPVRTDIAARLRRLFDLP